MGTLTKANHVHFCDTCHRQWQHAGYSCPQHVEAVCPACAGPPPDKKSE